MVRWSWAISARLHMPNHKPAHEVRLGAIKATIWRNDTGNGVRFNTTFTRLYRDRSEWKTTNSFGRDDLLVVAKVADQVHSWFANNARNNSWRKTNEIRMKSRCIKVDWHFAEYSPMTAFFFGSTRFTLGTLVVTPEAMKKVTLHEFNCALTRHGSEDVLRSTFVTERGVTVCVSTKPDRSITQILLPEEDGLNLVE